MKIYVNLASWHRGRGLIRTKYDCNPKRVLRVVFATMDLIEF